MKDSPIVKGIGKIITKGLFYTGKATYVTTVFVVGNLWRGAKLASKQIRKRTLEKEIEELTK